MIWMQVPERRSLMSSPVSSPIAGQTRGLSRFNCAQGTLIYLILLFDSAYKNTLRLVAAERLDDICDRHGQLGA
jgi:hypothetical protein